MRILDSPKEPLRHGADSLDVPNCVGRIDRGHAVRIVSRHGAEISKETREAGLSLLQLPFRHELDLGSVLEPRRLASPLKPDLIHVHKGLSHTLALAATWTPSVSAFVVNRDVSCDLSIRAGIDASLGGTGITGTTREAMAMALPVIATDCGRPSEPVSLANYCWLVVPRDVEHFSGDVRIAPFEALYRRIIEEANV